MVVSALTRNANCLLPSQFRPWQAVARSRRDNLVEQKQETRNQAYSWSFLIVLSQVQAPSPLQAPKVHDSSWIRLAVPAADSPPVICYRLRLTTLAQQSTPRKRHTLVLSSKRRVVFGGDVQSISLNGKVDMAPLVATSPSAIGEYYTNLRE